MTSPKFTMPKEDLKRMFDESMKSWGLPSQLLMLSEECSELSVASLHMLRDNKSEMLSLENFAEEIADVQFMIEEMLYYYHLVPKVAKYRKMKEARLIGLLEEEKVRI